MNYIAEITEIILNLSFTAFSIYGIHVLVKWKKAGEKVQEMCKEVHEEFYPTEKGGVE